MLGLTAAHADEGMWTYHHFPLEQVNRQFGLRLSAAWLQRLQHASVRLQNCSASFVSPEGLILTNHHCVEACLAEHSTRDRSLIDSGFLAAERRAELRCKLQTADVLVSVEEVTQRIAAATQARDPAAANAARKRMLTELEANCEKLTGLKCEAVTLYQGGQYFIYRYRRYDDVRLVFAPERAIAAFGGDPDNFQFPRWCLDVALLRAYDRNGQPARTPNHLRIRFAGPAAGEVVFVSGHPGNTDRLLTTAQYRFLRDVELPGALVRGSELRGRLIQFAKSGDAAARIAAEPLAALENGVKVRRKLLDALL
ncbi:MAG: S46 family peptidase, partial [Steroidobacteraceae bacterium]|nr:S46 family peptidase [Steroidobacteraceae bacterium]